MARPLRPHHPADRDALAERCREYKREWESAVERADSSEHLRKQAEASAAKVAEAINQWSIAIVHLIVAAPTVELRAVLKDMADSMLKARKILAADTAEKEKT